MTKNCNCFKKNGNEEAKKYWLSKFDASSHKTPDPKDSAAIKKFIQEKYKDKKYIGGESKNGEKNKEA